MKYKSLDELIGAMREGLVTRISFGRDRGCIKPDDSLKGNYDSLSPPSDSLIAAYRDSKAFIKSVDFSGCHMEVEELAGILHALLDGGNETLESLNLSWNELSGEAMVVLAQWLYSNKSLQKLDVGATKMDSNGYNLLAQSFEANRTLCSIKISDAKSQTIDARIALFAVIGKHPNLKDLSVIVTTANEVIALSGIVGKLEGLNVEFRGYLPAEVTFAFKCITREASQELMRSLEFAPHLRSLTIREWTKTGIEGNDVANIIKNTTTLKSLTIAPCEIPDDEVVIALNALAANATITRLEIIAKDDGSKDALMHALETNHTLQEFNVDEICWRRNAKVWEGSITQERIDADKAAYVLITSLLERNKAEAAAASPEAAAATEEGVASAAAGTVSDHNHLDQETAKMKALGEPAGESQL